MPHLEGKTQFLRYVEALDCVKDNIAKCYLLQVTRLESKEKGKKQNGSGYHLNRKRQKTKGVKLPEKFHDCQEEWETDEVN